MQSKQTRPTKKQKPDPIPAVRPRITVQLSAENNVLLDKARVDGRTPTWLVNKALRGLLTKMGYGA